MHKATYQKAMGCGAAWLLVAALEFLEAPGAGRPLSTFTIACLAFAVTISVIHHVFWRSHTPCLTQEETTILALPEVLPAPLRARVWLAISTFLGCVCILLIITNTIHGKPVWSLADSFGNSWIIPFLFTILAV